MAESLEDAEEIVAIAKSTGKRYSVLQNRRYGKEIRAFQSFLKSGALGESARSTLIFFSVLILAASATRWTIR